MIVGTSEIFSPVIGIRGSATIRIESKPSATKIKVEPTRVPAVQRLVLRICFLLRRLNIDIAVPKKSRGMRAYLPKRIAISDRVETAESTEGMLSGRIKAAVMPRTMPIKYLIQTFIILVYQIADKSAIIVRYGKDDFICR